jgi:hypothetical protein
LVKKLRRKKIATHAAVNQYLEQEYCDDHNQRFAVNAASDVDYHLPMPAPTRLREIFRLETERVLGNDWVVRHHNRLYQVERASHRHAPAKSTVLVCESPDGTVELRYRGQKLEWHAIAERPAQPEPAAPQPRKPSTPPAPAPQHPWRKGYRAMQARVPSRAPERAVSRAPACAPP